MDGTGLIDPKISALARWHLGHHAATDRRARRAKELLARLQALIRRSTHVAEVGEAKPPGGTNPGIFGAGASVSGTALLLNVPKDWFQFNPKALSTGAQGGGDRPFDHRYGCLSARVETMFSQTDLEDLARRFNRVLDKNQRLIRIPIHMDFDDDLTAFVNVVPIRQVFANLVDNAFITLPAIERGLTP